MRLTWLVATLRSSNAHKTPMEAAYGDPAVVMDRERNEVLIMAVAGCTVYGKPSTNRQNPNLIAANTQHRRRTHMAEAG